eukprot:scaffold172505_cov13-Tisochrysis_lutea.AAC.1
MFSKCASAGAGQLQKPPISFPQSFTKQKSPAQKAAFHKFQAHRKAAAAVMLNLLLLDCITCLPSGHQISSAPETAARLNMTSQTGLSSKNRIVFPAWLGSPCKCTCNQAGAGGHLFNHKYFELLDRIYRAHER